MEHVLYEDTLKSYFHYTFRLAFAKGPFQAPAVKYFIFAYAFCRKERKIILQGYSSHRGPR